MGLKQTFSWRVALCHRSIHQQRSETNIKDHLTGLVQQTLQWPLTPCCVDLRSTSDRPRRDPTLRKWHCCCRMTWLPFVWSTFEWARLLCSKREIGPRRAHIRWRPAIKMAAAGMISRASRLCFGVAAASDCKLFLRMLSFKSGPKSNKHEKDDPGFFASTVNTFITKLIFEFNLISF